MSLAKNIVSALASALPVGLGHSLAGSPLVLPYYHMVSDESLPYVAPLYRYRSVWEFASDVDFFLKHFKPVGLNDVLARVKHGTPLPPRAFLLTFDDGFREMAEVVAPILKVKGVPAVFFVNSAFVDNRELCMHQKIALLVSKLSPKPMPAQEKKLKELLRKNGMVGDECVSMLKSVRYANRSVLDEAGVLCDVDFNSCLSSQKPYLESEQIRALLRDGFAIGGHSIDHPFYGDLKLEEQLRQTRDSVDYVCENFGVATRAFAFPHSDTGVSRTFFEHSYGDGTVEISFGTGGLLRDAWPGHFQRFSMEKSSQSPRRILTWQLARRCVRGTVRRPTDSSSTPAAIRINKQYSA